MELVILAFKFKAFTANSSDFKIQIKLSKRPFITGNLLLTVPPLMKVLLDTIFHLVQYTRSKLAYHYSFFDRNILLKKNQVVPINSNIIKYFFSELQQK